MPVKRAFSVPLEYKLSCLQTFYFPETFASDDAIIQALGTKLALSSSAAPRFGNVPNETILKLTKTILTLLGCAALAGLFTGCPSVLCGLPQKFVIETKP